MSIIFADALTISDMIKARKISVREVLEEFFGRIDEVEPRTPTLEELLTLLVNKGLTFRMYDETDGQTWGYNEYGDRVERGEYRTVRIMLDPTFDIV